MRHHREQSQTGPGDGLADGTTQATGDVQGKRRQHRGQNKVCSRGGIRSKRETPETRDHCHRQKQEAKACMQQRWRQV